MEYYNIIFVCIYHMADGRKNEGKNKRKYAQMKMLKI